MMFNRFITLLITTAFQLAVASAGSMDSIFLRIEYQERETPIVARVHDAKQLIRYTDSAANGTNVSVYIIVTSATPIQPVIEALRRIPNLIDLTLYNESCQMAEAIFSSVPLPRLLSLSFSCPSYERVPSVALLPNLNQLSLHAPTGSYPCDYLKALRNLTQLNVWDTVTTVQCGCEPAQRLVFSPIDSLDSSIDKDSLFVTSGILTVDSYVYQLYSYDDKVEIAKIIPRSGTRQCFIEYGSVHRAPVGLGVPDRFIGTIYALVRAGLQMFDNEDPMLRSRFLLAVEDGTRFTIEVHDEHITLSNTATEDKYVYRGSLVPVMQRMIREGCL